MNRVTVQGAPRVKNKQFGVIIYQYMHRKIIFLSLSLVLLGVAAIGVYFYSTPQPLSSGWNVPFEGGYEENYKCFGYTKDITLRSVTGANQYKFCYGIRYGKTSETYNF